MQEIIHQAKMVILNQVGPGQNRCFTISTFTFKQGQNTTNDQINHFLYSLYTFTMPLNSIAYMQCILVMVYTHFLRKQNCIFRNYLALHQHDRGVLYRDDVAGKSRIIPYLDAAILVSSRSMKSFFTIQ